MLAPSPLHGPENNYEIRPNLEGFLEAARVTKDDGRLMKVATKLSGERNNCLIWIFTVILTLVVRGEDKISFSSDKASAEEKSRLNGSTMENGSSSDDSSTGNNFVATVAIRSETSWVPSQMTLDMFDIVKVLRDTDHNGDIALLVRLKDEYQPDPIHLASNSHEDHGSVRSDVPIILVLRPKEESFSQEELPIIMNKNTPVTFDLNNTVYVSFIS